MKYNIEFANARKWKHKDGGKIYLNTKFNYYVERT